MDANLAWFETFKESEDYKLLQNRPIAYFCAEIALTGESPTYAGGLGILSADTIREAADRQIPLVAVGLYYHEGYLHHELYAEGTMLKFPMRKKPEEIGLKQVLNEEKQPLIVSIPFPGRKVQIMIWEMQIGNTVTVYLLDSDLHANDPVDREITNRLYVTNKETRFKQEMVLGIGGLRALEAMKIHPSVYHLNEGHSALLSLEIARHEMLEDKKSFKEVLDHVKQHIIFTNHTLVAAGNDMFNSDMVSALLNDYSLELQVPVQEIVKLGLVAESSIFSMTVLALRMAYKMNGVSKLHAQKAKDIWPDYSMLAVTNGIHVPSWDKVPHGKTNNDQKQNETQLNLWASHQQNKKELLQHIFKITGQTWSEDYLLLGWARRMVRYKRPLSLFENKERLLRIVNDSKRPVRIVMAGSAHESDTDGAKTLEELQQIIISTFNGYVVYLPNYNMNLSKMMTSGCDVWLNTPVVGFEACGTSGMKAALNGVLPCTTKDGWAAEIDLYGIGWVLDSDNITQNLHDTIEHKIVPMYYFKDNDGIPNGWVENMKNSRELINNNYSATRMLKEYFTQLYLPSLAVLRESTQSQIK